MRKRPAYGDLIRHPLTQAALVLLLAVFVLRFGIRPPTPQSVFLLYMGIVLVAVILYISSNEGSWRSFRAALLAFLAGGDRWVVGLRWMVVVLLPLLVGYEAFAEIAGSARAPAALRQVHPAPPSSIQFRGKTLQIQGLDNPFWKGPPERPDLALVQEGREIYITHCVFCHGDALQGDGLFAQGLAPAPANFTDPATITQLQQSYLFWRIAKGGMSLPKEAAPWNSAMPAWEDDLTEDEIWKVILYLYAAAGPNVNPRTWD